MQLGIRESNPHSGHGQEDTSSIASFSKRVQTNQLHAWLSHASLLGLR